MNNLLYIIAIIFVIGWGLGYFALNFGNLAHLLLIVAIIAVLIRIIRGSKTT